MPRSMTRFPALVLLAGALLALGGSSAAAEPALAGTWAFKDVSNGGEVTLALLQIEEKDGKPIANVLAAPLLGKLMLSNVRIDERSIQFEFQAGPGKIEVSATASKDVKKPKVLRGTIKIGARTLLAEFERSDLKELKREDAFKKGPASEALEKAQKDKDNAALLAVFEKFPGSAAAYAAAQALFQNAVKSGAKDDELRTATERVIHSATPFGADVEQSARLSVTQALAKADKVSPLAVEYARQAEKLLSKDATPAQTAGVLKTLELALRKTGKTAEAKALMVRIDKIEEELDTQFEKTAVPFKPEPFKGRKDKSNRVVVVELFTGAQCPPCVSADVAFDAAIQAYKPTDVVLLQYHLHIPGPDPLTNADSEARARYYADDLQGTPTVFLDGKVTEGLGGYKQHGEERFKTLSGAINKELEVDARASLKLSVERKGDKLDVKANVADLKKPGEKVRLRFVLIEEVARYQGSNGQRLHHHVVRAFPGGVDGFPLKEAKDEQTVKVALGDLRTSLKEYLEAAGKKRPFRDDERPLNLKNLKIVALIQDDDSKEILQAAQVAVPEAK